MYVVALAGGIGSGKSLVAHHMRSHGAVTVDLDRVAEDLMVPGGEILARLVEAFGDSILNEDGSLSRSVLAEVAFSSKHNTRVLDEIVHPAVADAMVSLIQGMRAAEKDLAPPVLAFEIPLIDKLPELADLFDEVIAITAPKRIRTARAVARGMSLDDVLARIEIQPSDHERVVLSDTVFPNEEDSASLTAQVDRWWASHETTGWIPLRHKGESLR